MRLLPDLRGDIYRMALRGITIHVDLISVCGARYELLYKTCTAKDQMD
jgi:hypothetical protein